MATQVQFRRGTTGENDNFKGVVGEITVDTSINTVRIHDGSVVGGFPLLRNDGSNCELAIGSLTSCALKFAGDPNTGVIRPGADQLGLVTGGVARLTIDAAGAITIPGNLNISGNLSVTGAASIGDQLALILALS